MAFRLGPGARAVLVASVVVASPLGISAAQPDPSLLTNLGSLANIPAPLPMTIRPRVFAAYGSLIAAAMLSILYLYRGRAFIV